MRCNWWQVWDFRACIRKWIEKFFFCSDNTGRFVKDISHLFYEPNMNRVRKRTAYPIGSMYAMYGDIYHQYTPNVSIYTIHGSYGYGSLNGPFNGGVSSLTSCASVSFNARVASPSRRRFVNGRLNRRVREIFGEHPEADLARVFFSKSNWGLTFLGVLSPFSLLVVMIIMIIIIVTG